MALNKIPFQIPVQAAQVDGQQGPVAAGHAHLPGIVARHPHGLLPQLLHGVHHHEFREGRTCSFFKQIK